MENLKLVLLALFGMVMGQAVVWYAGQFYSHVLPHPDPEGRRSTANTLIIIATIVTTPFYVIFGKLSDRDRAQTHFPCRMLAGHACSFSRYLRLLLITRTRR